MSNVKIQIPAESLLECPACGLPAEIADRFTLGGAPDPVEHVKLVCVGTALVHGARRSLVDRSDGRLTPGGSRRSVHALRVSVPIFAACTPGGGILR